MGRKFLIFAAAGVILLAPSFTLAQSAPLTLDLGALVKELQEQIKTLQVQIVELKVQLEVAQKEATTTKGEVQATKEEVKAIQEELKLTKSLRRGESGDEVRKLQEFLSQFSDIYPEGLVTGYFGARTEAAVKKWQERQGIDSVGFVGPRTLTKINELINQGAGASGVIPPGLFIAPGIQERFVTTTIIATTSAPIVFITSSATTSTVIQQTTSTTAATSTTASATSTAAAATSTPYVYYAPPASSASTPSTQSSSANTTTTASATTSTTATSTTTSTSSGAGPITLSSIAVTVTASGNVQAPVFSWTSNRSAEGSVQLGPPNNPTGWNGPWGALKTSHSIDWRFYLGYFQNNSTYVFQVKSADPNGTSTPSGWLYLTTPSSPPTSATSLTIAPIVPENTSPVISNVQKQDNTFTWTTNEPANSIVEFSPSGGTAGEWNALATNHSVTAGYVSSGDASYRVKSTDMNGNTATSGWYPLTAVAPPDSSFIISQWKFDGNGVNEIVNRPAAVVMGNATFYPTGGKIGGYAYISSQSDYIKIPYNGIYDLPGAFSIEFWFRQRSNQSFNQNLVTKGTPINNYNFNIFRNLWNEYNFGPVIAGSTAAGTGYWHQVSNPNEPPHNTWHHVAYTKSAEKAAYYIDGVLIHSRNYASDNSPEYAGPVKTPAVDITIGNPAPDTDIDNLIIYNSYLSAGEVLYNYNSASAARNLQGFENQFANIASSLARLIEQVRNFPRK